MTDKFEDPCALNPPSKSIQSFSSWSEAFSVAKSVEPQDLGTFKPPSESSDKWGAGNVGMLSEIARQYHGTKRKVDDDQRKVDDDRDEHECDEKQKVKKRKKEKKDKKDKKKKRSNEEDEKNKRDSAQESPDETLDPLEDNQRPLEGQIVMHNGEQIMVLVDHKRKIVYSMERTPDGDLMPIGTVQGKQIVVNDESLGNLNDAENTNSFPFDVDADDHCESPLVAYTDILPILEEIAKLENKKKKKLKIYDPYYCNGTVAQHLQSLGFPKVYNKKEDAYKTWDPNDSSQPYPKYDVLITNPPYSGDHPERLIRHLQDTRMKGKSWALLMPSYIHKKDFYKSILSKKGNEGGIQPFYLVPKKRYVYTPPKNFREKKESDVHKKSSPFVSMWYIWGGSSDNTEKLIQAYMTRGNGTCELARSPNALRDLRRKGTKK